MTDQSKNVELLFLPPPIPSLQSMPPCFLLQRAKARSCPPTRPAKGQPPLPGESAIEYTTPSAQPPTACSQAAFPCQLPHPYTPQDLAPS
ncbi:unnamed protein product [Dicrocoelium dendriticum]|nr:unnamed protein product [Dicrocoelium dendriticum]